MKGFRYLWLLVVSGWTGCSTVNVRDEVHVDDFVLGNYQTFDFRTGHIQIEKGISGSDDLNEIKNALKKQLLFRGITQNESDPDLLIDISGIIKEEVQTRETDIISDPPRYVGQRRYTWKVDTVETGRYLKGSFKITLHDPLLDKPVWSGVIEGVLPEREMKRRKIYYQSVQELFKDKTSGLSFNLK